MLPIVRTEIFKNSFVNRYMFSYIGYAICLRVIIRVPVVTCSIILYYVIHVQLSGENSWYLDLVT